jgi:hypothetical protein
MRIAGIGTFSHALQMRLKGPLDGKSRSHRRHFRFIAGPLCRRWNALMAAVIMVLVVVFMVISHVSDCSSGIRPGAFP